MLCMQLIVLRVHLNCDIMWFSTSTSTLSIIWKINLIFWRMTDRSVSLNTRSKKYHCHLQVKVHHLWSIPVEKYQITFVNCLQSYDNFNGMILISHISSACIRFHRIYIFRCINFYCHLGLNKKWYCDSKPAVKTQNFSGDYRLLTNATQIFKRINAQVSKNESSLNALCDSGVSIETAAK